MKKWGLIVLAVVGGESVADEWLLNVDLGRSSTNSPTINLPEALGTGSVVRDKNSDTGYAVSIDYVFSDTWTARLGYTDLGSAELIFRGDTITPDAFIAAVGQSPILAEGISISAIYRAFHRDAWHVDFELGLFRWEADQVTSALGRTLRRSDNSTDLVWGVALGYEMTSKWTFNAGYRSFELSERIAFPHVGLTYAF